MMPRSFIAIALAVVVLVGAAGAVYAYDSSRKGKIAGGVSVGGIDLGGMSRARAEATLRARLAAPLERPVVVRYGSSRFRLDPRRARLRVDVDAIVDQALARSREGGLLSRAWRALTGGEVHAQVAPRVTYSRAAVRALVKRVKARLDRPAKDASIAWSVSGIRKVPSRPGVAIRGLELARDVEAALVTPDGPRVVQAHAKITRPQVTTDQLPARYPVALIVNRDAKRLRLYKRLRLVRTYKIAVGMVGLETPAGLYHIQNKAVNPAWHVPKSAWAGDLAGKVIPGGAPDNPIKARWLGIFDGAGIHGTTDIASLGTAASHGCIRMSIPDVEELYPQVPVNTPVYIG